MADSEELKLQIPWLDQVLGGVMVACSVIAAVGNTTGMVVMARICKKGNATFSTIIFLNVAFANLVRIYNIPYWGLWRGKLAV